MIVSIKVATPAKAATTAAMHPMSGIVFEYRFTSAFRFPVAFLFAFHMSSQYSSWDMSSRFFFCIFLHDRCQPAAAFLRYYGFSNNITI